MRTKSLQAPTGVEKGHEWLSPDGHSAHWHRIWNGTVWQNYEEDSNPNFGKESKEEEDLDDDDTEDDDDNPTEETTGERSNETEVSDRDGKQEPDGRPQQPPARKQSKGGKGKRR